MKNNESNLENLIFSFFLNFLTFFLLCILTLRPAFYSTKSYVQKLILSKSKLPYKIQFLRKPQLEITVQNSTIDFFWHSKISISIAGVNCQPSYPAWALSAEVHVTPSCLIILYFINNFSPHQYYICIQRIFLLTYTEYHQKL